MKIKKLVIGLMLMLTVISSGISMAGTNDYGALGASADDSYTLEEMLIYAIQDEYLARSEYEAIIETFEITRPFSNIMKSEETHIALLKPLFETYGFEIPEDISANQLVIPEVLLETFAIGVEVEINNIAMYEAFLEEDLPEDVEMVFERLLKSSENHLRAFENGLNRQSSTNRRGWKW